MQPASGPPERANAALRRLVARWRSRPVTERLARDLADYASGRALAECPELARLLHEPAEARRFVSAIMLPVLAALGDNTLAEVPMRARVSRGLSQVQLIEAGGAVLSLCACEPLHHGARPESALFVDQERREIVIEGRARGQVHRLNGEGALTSRAVKWQTGSVIGTKARIEARQVTDVDETLVLLQLTRSPRKPAPTRQIALGNGQTLALASGDKSASEAVMALAVLGAMGQACLEKVAANVTDPLQLPAAALLHTLSHARTYVNTSEQETA